MIGINHVSGGLKKGDFNPVFITKFLVTHQHLPQHFINKNGLFWSFFDHFKNY